MACTGEDTEMCGGYNAMTLYEDTNFISPIVRDGYTLQGCYSDSHTLTRALPNEWDDPEMTIELCIDHAAAGGYNWAGIEFSGYVFPSTFIHPILARRR
jgi:hypothetical protein